MRRSVAVLVGVFAAVVAVAAQAPQQPAAGAPAGRGRGGPPTRISQFEAKPASIKPGESATLVWLVENPGAPAIEPGVGRVTPRGTMRVTPNATTTYTLTAGDQARSVTVTVAGTQPVAASAPAATAAPAASR